MTTAQGPTSPAPDPLPSAAWGQPSARRERDQLRRVMDHVMDAYVAVDPHGAVTEWNRAAEALFGWRRDEVLGLPLTQVMAPVPPDGDADAPTPLDWSRWLGTPPRQEVQTRSGEVLTVQITTWTDPEDDAGVVNAFLRDISDRMSERAAQGDAHELLESFAAMAAHDLRSPLSIVSLNAETLSEQIEAGSLDLSLAAHAVRAIERATERGLTLIGDLLEYASIGRAASPMAEVDLDALVGAALADEQGSTDRVVAVECAELPVVPGSASLLRQLFGNLIGNAIKYVPADRTVTMVIDAVPEPEGHVTIRITDNGDPIDAADHERLFTIFERGRGTRPAGHGVGLAICRRVAEAHGGRIFIDPEFEGGNRFCLTLPTHAI